MPTRCATAGGVGCRAGRVFGPSSRDLLEPQLQPSFPPHRARRGLDAHGAPASASDLRRRTSDAGLPQGLGGGTTAWRPVPNRDEWHTLLLLVRGYHVLHPALARRVARR